MRRLGITRIVQLTIFSYVIYFQANLTASMYQGKWITQIFLFEVIKPTWKRRPDICGNLEKIYLATFAMCLTTFTTHTDDHLDPIYTVNVSCKICIISNLINQW